MDVRPGVQLVWDLAQDPLFDAPVEKGVVAALLVVANDATVVVICCVGR